MKKSLLFSCLLLPVMAFAQPGVITTIAGNGSFGFSGDGGQATAAGFSNPKGVTFDAAGNMYIADYSNSAVRKVTTSGIIRTLAGVGTYGFSGDGGPATAARLDGAMDVAVDAGGNIFIADYGNNVVRKINTSGIISTFAGNHASGAGYSGDGGPATAAKLNRPSGIKLDGAGNLYITDAFNNRIRKVNASGIISTIAGNGTAGYAGDGGPATAANLDTPSSIAIDYLGNILICDKGNYVIRLINTAGVISTIAGNGTSGCTGDGGPAAYATINPSWVTTDVSGNIYFSDVVTHRVREINQMGYIGTIAGMGTSGFSGDGGPATAAKLNAPEVITCNGNNMFISDLNNQRIRALANPDTFLHITDSMGINVVDSCGTLTVCAIVKHYAAGMYVKTYYGDGTNGNTTVTPASYGTYGLAFTTHTYASAGFYTLKNVLYVGSAPVDSMFYSFHHYRCPTYATVEVYDDANGDCIHDAAENGSSVPLTIEIDSNGVAIDTISCTTGFTYSKNGSVGDIYQYKVISPGGLGMVPSCPTSGIISDTVMAGVVFSAVRSIGMSCSSSSSAFDLSIYSESHSCSNPHFDSVTREEGYIWINNLYCNPTAGTVQLNFSPKLTYDAAYPTPYSIGPGSITWNFTGLSSSMTGLALVNYHLIQAGSSPLHAGDTVNLQIILTPTSGDADTTNNTVNVIDTVVGSFDPNYIKVVPSSHIVAGAKLKYTINFENTGNDTAFNIYLMDTLSNDLDLESYNIVAASHKMFVTKLKDGAGHNILKFEFPEINLLDSSHHGLCDGTVTYTINTKPGLPDCEQIPARAGIYFDYNDVVMTNTANAVIGCWLGAENLTPAAGTAQIYPSPATDELNIKADNEVFKSLVITNSVGSTVLSQSIVTAHTQINIKSLPAGLYYVLLKGQQGNVVRKFVKM